MSNVATAYLREIDRQIVCPKYLKKRFLCQLKNEVYFFCEDHGDVNTNSIQERFGRPEDVAQAFLLEVGPKTVKWCNTVRRWILFIIIAILLPMISLASYLEIRVQMLQHQFPNEEHVAYIMYEDTWAESTLFPQKGFIFENSK